MSRLASICLFVWLCLPALESGAQSSVTYLGANSVLPSETRLAAPYPLVIGGTQFETIYAVASDAVGNAYVTGGFTGTIDFDPGPGVTQGTSANGSQDLFAASYDAAGNLRWAFSIGSGATELGTSIAVAGDRVYLGGIFNGSLTLGGSTITSAGDADGFVAAIDAATGGFVWATRFGGLLADGNPQLAVSGSQVFAVARYIGPASFGATTLPATDSYDVALAALAVSNGAIQWARTIFDGPGQQFEGGVATDGARVVAGARSDGNRNGLVGAYQPGTGLPIFETPVSDAFPASVTTADGVLYAVGATAPAVGSSDVWLGAYGASGSSLWARTVGGSGTDQANSVGVLNGALYVGGSFEETVDFDPGAGTATHTSAGEQDAFVARYALADGAFVQSEAFGGPGSDMVWAVAGGEISGLVAGAFSGTADLDPTPGQIAMRTAAGGQDAFLARFFPEGAPDSFVVSTTADAGAGSFRQALLDAGGAGGGIVTFAIPGPVPHVITPASPLPFVTAPVVIDGFTQPGSQPNTAGPWAPSNAVMGVVLVGTAVGATGSGLVLQGESSTVRGLAIGGFPWHGIILDGGADHRVEGSYIGTDATGMEDRGNGISGIWVNGSGNAEIGGANPAQRMVIAGNESHGVLVYGAGASGTRVRGAFIGTNAAGDSALPNTQSGIITGSNVIFNDPNPSEALDVWVGGILPGEGNLISGNNDFGVGVFGFAPTGSATTLGDTRIQGNRIGTNAAGTAALPNRLAGVLVRRNPTGVTIGGAEPEAGNVVSGNADDGIIVEISDGILVENNLVGTDAAGTQPLGNRQSGILLFCARNAIVRGNVASANGTGTGDSVGGGIGGTCTLTNVQGTGNRIVGNWIGTDKTGTEQMGNGLGGVVFSQRHGNEVVGGDGPGEANVIAFNIGPAVIVRSTLLGPVRIGPNAMYGNGAPGIDIEPIGRAVNDPLDADTGANRQQNYPVLSSATGDGASTLMITYSVDTAMPNATYPLRVDFYRADAAGREGEAWLGSHTYTTPQATAVAYFTPAVILVDGDQIVATATDASGNSSEFSDAVTGSLIVSNEEERATPGFDLTVAPNPVRSAAGVRLTIATPGDAHVVLYDALGRRVAVIHDGPLTAGAHVLALNASHLAPGMYLLRANSGDATHTHRLIVVR